MIIKRQSTCTITQLREVLQLMESEGHGTAMVNLGKWCNDDMLTTLIGAHSTFQGSPAWSLDWAS
jgi:hypothetical protein